MRKNKSQNKCDMTFSSLPSRETEMKGRRMVRNKEHGIQVAIMAYLDMALPASCRAFAVPNGGRRDRITGAILKAEGVKAGVPDIAIVRGGGVAAFIEVKTDAGRLSNSQIEWRDWCGENNVPYAVVRQIGDVQVALLDWGISIKARAV